MTATARPARSVWCDAADALGVPEGHRSCPGTGEQRLPCAPEWPPIQTYRCDCTCHISGPAFIGRRSLPPIAPQEPS